MPSDVTERIYLDGEEKRMKMQERNEDHPKKKTLQIKMEKNLLVLLYVTRNIYAWVKYCVIKI